MDQASLYSKYSGLQKHDALFVIGEYFRLIKWKTGENIMDIGCGDGDVTIEILLPKLPKDFNKIIGVDMSEAMVTFAKKRCEHSKIDFTCLDIAAKDIPTKFRTSFDHIFSFYCLHWVMDQGQALQNILDLLKPGGDVLLTFLASNPIYDIYEKMAESKTWLPYMKNVNKYISPYHHSKNPGFELEKLLTKTGFSVHLCKVENRSYVFPSFAVLSKSVAAVNPFIKHIPEGALNSFVEDYLKEVRNLHSVTIEKVTKNNNFEENIHVPYKLFIVFASKPL